MAEKEIGVYIQKPWKFADSPYYKPLRESPPVGVKYMNLGVSNLIQNRKSMEINTSIKQFIKKIIRKFYPSMPNAHWTRNAKNYDLIHCAHCLSKNKRPWVCDIEYVGQFWAGGYSANYPNKKKILRYLESPYCKKILAWTEWARDGIVKEFPEIKNKVEVVYPTVPEQKFKKIKSNKIKLLFVSRRFYFKGGFYALEVMDRLTKKYDSVEGVIVSDVPEEVYKKYKGNKKIKFLGMMPQRKLFEEVYPSADIFVYPSFTDTFGFAITEAMSFGLPVVSCSGRSRRELIENRKTGFIVNTELGDLFDLRTLKNLDERIASGLQSAIKKIIENKKFRNEISENCRKLIKDGKFSIKNKKLKQIYKKAI